MSIKRYTAIKDNTITNALKSNLVGRGTGSNMGASDVLETFSIYGQTFSGSLPATASTELSRILVKFQVTGSNSIKSDRSAGTIPKSGSVSFYLRLFNTKHAFTVPRDFTLAVHPVSRSWAEGAGLDMEEYSDLGNCNWVRANDNDAWTNYGGDFHTGTYAAGTNLPFYSTHFERGTEDLEVDITSLVEEWIDVTAPELTAPRTTRQNYGVGIFLTSTQEAHFSGTAGADGYGSDSQNTNELHNTDGATKSYYTKKFFARGSQFFYKRPIIEARWDSSKKDNAGSFYLSSSLVAGADNLNTLYFYNFVRGQLKDIPHDSLGTGRRILLSAFPVTGGVTAPADTITLPLGGGVVANDDINVTGGYVSTGIYSASFAFTSSVSNFYPVWHTGSSGVANKNTVFFTGSAVKVLKFGDNNNYNPNPKYFTKITNLRSEYRNDETARFRLFTRRKDWSPTIYTKATADIKSETIEDSYYKAFRVVDDFEVVPYGTGSLNYTRLSYDVSGSYFDLDMSLFETGYAYGIKFLYYVNGIYTEQPEVFKFRIE